MIYNDDGIIGVFQSASLLSKDVRFYNDEEGQNGKISRIRDVHNPKEDEDNSEKRKEKEETVDIKQLVSDQQLPTDSKVCLSAISCFSIIGHRSEIST